MKLGAEQIRCRKETFVQLTTYQLQSLVLMNNSLEEAKKIWSTHVTNFYNSYNACK